MPIYGKTPNQNKTLSGHSPLTFYSNGDNLTSYTISGNGKQDGTPSPDNSIMPDFCGVRTAQLIPFPYKSTSGTITGVTVEVSTNGRIKATGTTTGGYNWYLQNASMSLPAGTYTVSFVGKIDGVNLRLRDVARAVQVAIVGGEVKSQTFTLSEDCNDFRIYLNTGQTGADVDCDFVAMLNLGSTALPYEPYGWAEKITCAGQTTPVYLGQTQTVRRVKKLVLTGEETIAPYDATYSRFAIIIPDSLIVGVRLSPAICSHYPVISDGRSITSVPNNAIYSDSGNGRWFIKTTDITTVADFKSYLAQQYAAGTPVTAWYILTNEQTGIVNEPLAKIGDYADTLVYYTGAPQIPTVGGKNVLSVDTELRPSLITIQYTSGNEPIKEIYGNTSGAIQSKTSVPPITINAKQGNLLSYSISGNTVQNGTPSPDNIIMPDSCGVGTAQLFDKDNTTIYNLFPGAENTIRVSSNARSIAIPCVGGETYTISKKAGQRFMVCFTTEPVATQVTYTNLTTDNTAESITVVAPSDSKYLFVYFYNSTADTDTVETLINSIMINLGAAPLQYEPYGYKIQITCAGQTTPVYLGQVQTVRRVKKLEVNIDRMIDLASGYVGAVTRAFTQYAIYIARGFCDIFPYGGTSVVNSYYVNQKNAVFVLDAGTTLEEAKELLNGHFIWYILAEPETAFISEPLCKIGDYSDTISSEQSGVQVPTVEGINIISVDTAVQPSSMTVSYTSPDYSRVIKVLDASGNLVWRPPVYYDWNTIREVVRAGKAAQYYPIGSILYDNFDANTGVAYQVVGYDKHFDPALTAAGYTHSMTLCELLLIDVITFDAIEAFLYVTTAIPAGTYKFTIPNYDASYGGNKTYYFTSTAELPVNSQIVMNWPYNQTPKTVTGYAPTASLTAMENTTAATGWNALTLTEWVDGTSPTATDLGTIAGPSTQAGTSNYGDMNHIHRARYGSNNYYESGVRQYINATGAANTWWKPSNKFDRPYGSRSIAGKLNTLNQDFVNVLAYPTIKSKANTYFETTAEDGTTFTLGQDYTITTDKMFLLSPVEVGFSTTDTSIGTLLDYYVNATDATRVKIRKSNNNPYYWWLRTPYPSSAFYVRSVTSSGALYSYVANNSSGVAPACIIQ